MVKIRSVGTTHDEFLEKKKALKLSLPIAYFHLQENPPRKGFRTRTGCPGAAGLPGAPAVSGTRAAL